MTLVTSNRHRALLTASCLSIPEVFEIFEVEVHVRQDLVRTIDVEIGRERLYSQLLRYPLTEEKRRCHRGRPRYLCMKGNCLRSRSMQESVDRCVDLPPL